jgi:hypothetical protein
MNEEFVFRFPVKLKVGQSIWVGHPFNKCRFLPRKAKVIDYGVERGEKRSFIDHEGKKNSYYEGYEWVILNGKNIAGNWKLFSNSGYDYWFIDIAKNGPIVFFIKELTRSIKAHYRAYKRARLHGSKKWFLFYADDWTG